MPDDLRWPCLVDVRTVELRIDDMTCEGCAAVVQIALTKVPGVQGASVSFPQGQARITLDPDATPSLETLRRAVEKAGYQASIEYEQETQ